MARIDSYLGKIAGDEITPKPPVTRLDKNLNKIAENGGGSSLPDYSEASDGDVLSIEDGAPAWKEPSGGGGDGTFVVNITLTQDGGTMSATADKTYAEISAAMADGKICVANMGNWYYGFFYPYPLGTGAVVATAILVIPSQSEAFLTTATVVIANDESIQVLMGNYTLTPVT